MDQEETHAEKVARLKAEVAALRAQNDQDLEDAETALQNLERAIERKEAAEKSDGK